MKRIKIYCSPSNALGDIDWNIIYTTPENLFETKLKNMNKAMAKHSNIFYCPSFKNYANKTYIISNPIHTTLKVTDDGEQPFITSQNHVGLKFEDSRSITNHFHFTYEINWVFFAEEDVKMTLTSPHFDTLPFNGALCPGQFNISKWFRTTNCEYVIPREDQTIDVPEDVPLAYVHFDTEYEVELVRFHMTPELKSILNSCDTSSGWERFIPLQKRYKRFVESRQKAKTLKLIKDNLY